MVIHKTKSFKNGEGIRNRLLDSAEELFSSKGFSGTSVKDITDHAKCNIAAVNYHFGSKENLYNEVFQRLITFLRDSRIACLKQVMDEKGEALTLEDLLSAFAHGFLEPLLQAGKRGQIMQLILRERLNPHLPPALFFHEVIKPIFSEFQKAMRAVVPNLTQEDIYLCAHSFIAQLMDVIRRAHKHQEEFAVDRNSRCPEINRSIRHIVDFSVAGIRAIENKSGKG